jgi:hypothetical protein
LREDNTGGAVTCEQVGARKIDVLSLLGGSANASTVREDKFSCTGSSGAFDILGYPFDVYWLRFTAVNDAESGVSSTTELQYSASASGCNRVVDGYCVRDLHITFTIRSASVDGGASADGGAVDGGDAAATGWPPTTSGIYVEWRIETQDSMLPRTCEQIGASKLDVMATPTGPLAGRVVRHDTASCTGSSGTFNAWNYEFGDWTIDVKAIDSKNVGVGKPAQIQLKAAASPCSRVVFDNCVRNYVAVLFAP